MVPNGVADSVGTVSGEARRLIPERYCCRVLVGLSSIVLDPELSPESLVFPLGPSSRYAIQTAASVLPVMLVLRAITDVLFPMFGGLWDG